MPKKAIIYCRVSSEKQANEGHGLDGQQLRCEQRAEAKKYVHLKTFRDEGFSGGAVDRPGMKALLTFLGEQAVSEDEPIIVLMDDISRNARDIQAHFLLKNAIESRNGKIEYVSMEFEDSPMGKLLETIMAGSAEYARNENTLRVRKNMKSRVENGYWSFCHPPGYKYHEEDLHGKVLRRDDPKAAIIQEALDGFANHRFESKVEVKKFLETKQFCHRAEFKGVVHLQQVTRLLERAYFYAGFIEYGNWEVIRRIGHHDAIISIETMEKIEKRLGETERRTFRKDLNRDFPLRGFLACAHCNHLMTASWSKGRTKHYPFYRCATRGCVFQHKSVGGKKAEEDFALLLKRMTPRKTSIKLVEAILRDLWDQRMDLELEQDKARQQQIKKIDKEIDTLCERLTHIKSPILIRKLESRVDQLEAKQRSLDTQKTGKEDSQKDFGTALTAVCNFIQNPSVLWNSEVFEDKRTVLNLAFVGILPYDKHLGFGTTRFALPFELCKVSETEKMKLVEMPGIEPGSNV